MQFCSTDRPSLDDLPLTCEEFESLWSRLALSQRDGNGHIAITDTWRLELLNVLCCDCFFTSSQANTIVTSICRGDDKVDAAVRVRTMNVEA